MCRSVVVGSKHLGRPGSTATTGGASGSERHSSDDANVPVLEMGDMPLKRSSERDQHACGAACLSATSTDVYECDDSLEKSVRRVNAVDHSMTTMVVMLQEERDGWASRPQSDFLLEQNITAGDRASIVDTMTRVATQLQLPSDVLFMGVSCLDRFLAAAPLQPILLDAASLACLWVAVKFEQRLVPSAVQFLAAAQHDCSSAANKSLLVDVEAQVLKALEYRMHPYPTIKAFLRTIFDRYKGKLQQIDQDHLIEVDSTAISRYNSCCTVDSRLYYTASYLAEASLLEYKLVPCAPSQVAAAVFASANLLVGCPLHDAQLLELTGYSLSSIKPAMQWLLAVHHVLYEGRSLPKDSMYETVRKHMHANMCKVAFIPSISSVLDPRLCVAAC